MKSRINTISDEVDAQESSYRFNNNSPQHNQDDISIIFSNQSSLNNSDNNATQNRRKSTKRQSRKNRRVENEGESIVLQDSKGRPVTLKASFLRRKIKEYEGKLE
jgi:hypothetical protein